MRTVTFDDKLQQTIDYRAFSVVDKWSRRDDDHDYRDLRDVYWNRLARERGEIEWSPWKISSRGEHHADTENILRVNPRKQLNAFFFHFQDESF